MKKFLLPLTMVALCAIPATASAEMCRNQANGRFAKCGTPGSVLASQYKAKKAGAPAMKPMAPAMKPAAAPAMKPAAAPAMKPAMAAKCKDTKGKFIKCPVAPAMKPAMKPAAKM